MSLSPYSDFTRHLRLPFQLALAPFFLLGSLLSGVRPDAGWVVLFVLVHVALYGGATVYNSYHDKDTGPVGMLKRPPTVTRGMYDLSIALQMLAVAALAWTSWKAGLIAAVMMALSAAYSHTRTRLKDRTWSGLFAVGLGQGALAVLLGLFAAGGAEMTPHAGRAALAATFTVLGLYPLTQIYQIDEDRARGDRTLPVRFGWRFTMAFSALVASTGLAFLLHELRGELPDGITWWTMLIVALLGLVTFLAAWWRRFEALGVYRNHDWAMAVSVGVSAPISVLLLVQLMTGAA